MKISSIFHKKLVWTIALYKLKSEDEILKIELQKPFHFISENGLRINKKYQTTTADPFLYTHEDRLYLFYEVQTDFGVGEIWAQSMDALGEWSSHGCVLNEDFHLSYPQVFSLDGKIWMIPEASASGKVWLYSAEVFPNEWIKSRILIHEVLLDPSIIIQSEGIFLLGTTRENELKIYFSQDLNHEFILTNIVKLENKFLARNAGRPIYVKNILYRLAQDNQYGYGQSISLLQIDELTISKYSEHISMTALFKIRPKWMKFGCHHLSTAVYRNKHFVAVDGMRKDKFINTLLLAFIKSIEYFKRTYSKHV